MYLYQCGQLCCRLTILVLAHAIPYSDDDSAQYTTGESLELLVGLKFNSELCSYQCNAAEKLIPSKTLRDLS